MPEAVTSTTYDAGNRQLTFGPTSMTFDDTGNLAAPQFLDDPGCRGGTWLDRWLEKQILDVMGDVAKYDKST